MGICKPKRVDEDSAKKMESHANLQMVTGKLPYSSYLFVTKAVVRIDTKRTS